jgi:hypothetical protein
MSDNGLEVVGKDIKRETKNVEHKHVITFFVFVGVADLLV